MKQTSFEEFVELASRGTFVPVYKEILADLLTPAAAFLKVAEHADYAFLLESVEGGERVARYSFLGKDPFLVLRARNGQAVIERAGETEVLQESFVDALRRVMAEYRSPAARSGSSATTPRRGSSRPSTASGNANGDGSATRPAKRPSCSSTRCSRSITCVTASC